MMMHFLCLVAAAADATNPLQPNDKPVFSPRAEVCQAEKSSDPGPGLGHNSSKLDLPASTTKNPLAGRTSVENEKTVEKKKQENSNNYGLVKAAVAVVGTLVAHETDCTNVVECVECVDPDMFSWCCF